MNTEDQETIIADAQFVKKLADDLTAQLGLGEVEATVLQKQQSSMLANFRTGRIEDGDEISMQSIYQS